MIKSHHILTKRLAALSAVVAGVCAITALGGKVGDLQVAAAWKDKAISYQSGDFSHDALTEDMAENLAIADKPVSRAQALFKDYAQTQSLMPVKYVHHKAAKHVKSEQVCLAQAVYYEARSERRSGQMAVAEVVLNRVQSKHYPNSVCGVVYQGSGRKTGCQFSFTCDGSMKGAPKGAHWTKAQKIARLMLTHDVKPLTRGATHYHTTAISPKWSSNLRFDREIGTHKFYRFNFTERPVISAAPSLAIAPPI